MHDGTKKIPQLVLPKKSFNIDLPLQVVGDPLQPILTPDAKSHLFPLFSLEKKNLQITAIFVPK